MDDLPNIAEAIHRNMEARNQARDQALSQARQLTRHASLAIRAVHRNEYDIAHENVHQASKIMDDLKQGLSRFPELYFSGYTQDAIKEYVEACITSDLIENHHLPTPADLQVDDANYLNGMAEVCGELRRRCLDILRQGYSQEAEWLLGCMDEIYATLVTMDYPDALTNGLRRQTDLVRGIVERTRGDLTISLREQHLEQSMQNLTHFLHEHPHADDSRL